MCYPFCVFILSFSFFIATLYQYLIYVCFLEYLYQTIMMTKILTGFQICISVPLSTWWSSILALLKWIICNCNCEKGNDKSHTRHVTLFKNVNIKELQTTLTPVSEKTQSMHYHKQNCNQVDRWYFQNGSGRMT